MTDQPEPRVADVKLGFRLSLDRKWYQCFIMDKDEKREVLIGSIGDAVLNFPDLRQEWVGLMSKFWYAAMAKSFGVDVASGVPVVSTTGTYDQLLQLFLGGKS